MGNVWQKAADILRAFSEKENKRLFTSAVILAAGSGERFGTANGRKQFCPLLSVPVLVHTLRAFEACDYITEIIVVTRAEDILRCEEYGREYGITKLKCVVPGGEDRQSSSKRGLDAISPEAEYVAVHDGARCLVTPQIIADTVRAAYEYGAAVAAEPARDTVKIASESGFARETPDRKTVWLAKTPQVFLANMLRAAVYTAQKDKITATDDSALAERLGFKVKMVDCGSENLKITLPIDIKIAEAILRAREEGGN